MPMNYSHFNLDDYKWVFINALLHNLGNNLKLSQYKQLQFDWHNGAVLTACASTMFSAICSDLLCTLRRRYVAICSV